MSVSAVAGSDSATAAVPQASAPTTTRRQPIRSAAVPASGPSAPRPHIRKIRPPTAWLQRNGGASRRKVTNEKTPTKAKKSALAAAVACCSPRLRARRRTASQRRAVLSWRGASGNVRAITTAPAAGRSDSAPTGQRQPKTVVASAMPTRPTMPPLTSAGDVEAHRAPAELGAEHLDDVRRADREQARHAQALDRTAGEQDAERRGERRRQRRHRDQRAREHERLLAAPSGPTAGPRPTRRRRARGSRSTP
jgi:hypothetical protein